MCSPDSSMIHWTMGSDLAKRFRPKQTLHQYKTLSLSHTHTQTQYNTNKVYPALLAHHKTSHYLWCFLVGQLSLPQFKNWHLPSLHTKVGSVAIWGNYKNTVKPGYNNVSLYNTSSIRWNILWYQFLTVNHRPFEHVSEICLFQWLSFFW
jgi:hypothetical protein